ncbi:MAG: tetratricopeptide repeat protein [Anaerolineae bacterium]|nr:tetratricopeptide repeat protein [Anaerolineae bacterium]
MTDSIRLVVCPHCGSETPNYEDCVLCGHSLRDPDAPPRDVSQDEMQEIMMEAALGEIRARRQILYGDAWDHAPWLARLQALAQIAPDHARVHYYIGAAQTEMGQCREAIVSYTRALAADPGMADAVRRRGDCHYVLVPVLGEDVQVYYDRALADYEAALVLEPDAYTYAAHASIIAALGRTDEAIDEFDQAAALAPDYPDIYYGRGEAYRRKGEDQQALDDFRTFLAFEDHWNDEMVAAAEAQIKDITEGD